MTTVPDALNMSTTTQDTKLCKIASANPKYFFKNKVNPKAAEDDPNKNLWSLEDLIDGFGKKGVLCSKTLDTRNQCLRFRIDLAALAAADPQFRDAQAKLAAAAAAGAAAAATATSDTSGMGYSPGAMPPADSGSMQNQTTMPPADSGGPMAEQGMAEQGGPMPPTDTAAAAASGPPSQGMETSFMEPPPPKEEQPPPDSTDLGSSDLDRKRQDVLAAAVVPAIGGLKKKVKGPSRTTRKNPMPPSKGRGGQGPDDTVCPPQCKGATPGTPEAVDSATGLRAMGGQNTTGDLGSSTKLFLVHEKIDKDERGWWDKLTNQPVIGGQRSSSRSSSKSSKSSSSVYQRKGMGNSLRMIKDLMKQNKQLQQYSKRQRLLTQKRKHQKFQRQLTRKRCL